VRLKRLLARALDCETTDPKSALRLYRRLEKANRARYRQLLPLAVVSPVAVTALVQFVGRLPDPWGRYAILVALSTGYLPLYFAFSRLEQRRGFDPASAGTQLFWLFGFLAAVLWQPLILLTYIMAVATILGLATVGPLSLVVPVPLAEVRVAIEVSLLLLALAWVFSGLWPPLPRWRYLPGEVLAGLKRNGGEVVQFLAGLAAALFLGGGGFLGLVYERPWQALLAAGGSGLLLGLGCRSHAGRKPELLCLGLLGQARCLVRLNHRADCSQRVREIFEAAPFLRPHAMEKLAETTAAFEGRHLERDEDPREVAASMLGDAKRLPPPRDVPTDLWSQSLRNTELLISDPQ